ncbi:hypothetical protein SEA_TOMAS_277 [Streptomyces phage Tomas]|uniref:Uncharacterized protein n=1 Tax=Streptomyces phage Tomas TaxID=2914443 RepID=A0AA49BT84_9CAUD|nr:hypothetical protein PP453_gp021 [Streptomyces phage Tomas]YP_010651359.1 hypothetical protein PP453_gp047 [Streptomyces phage Tomas]UMO76212.1 hypothetical protein SEA_TOMAS_21 [Streptomyces phage Tomas]UMO76420.1 hypothetical protein SEA_TOMAS_277 [Streptomyces phage Tomas]
MAVTLAKEVVYLNVYETSLGYGGPEEGNWYFDCGEWVTSMYTTRPTAEKYQEEWREGEYRTRRSVSSVIHKPGDSYDVVIETTPPQDYPLETPRYE